VREILPRSTGIARCEGEAGKTDFRLDQFGIELERCLERLLGLHPLAKTEMRAAAHFEDGRLHLRRIALRNRQITQHLIEAALQDLHFGEEQSDPRGVGPEFLRALQFDLRRSGVAEVDEALPQQEAGRRVLAVLLQGVLQLDDAGADVAGHALLLGTLHQLVDAGTAARVAGGE
jgi:hypothetical protein